MEMAALAPWRPPAAASRSHWRLLCSLEAAKESFGLGGNHMFIFGMGYVGRYVSERLKRQGWHVSGTCRDDIKRRELEKMGFDAFTFNINNNELGSLSTLGEATHILISIPSDVNFGDPLMSLHEDLRCSLSSGNLQWLGYLSSTSVYGNCGGAWVDEDYPVDPSLETTKSRLAAEISWQELGCQLGCLVNVFRLGGIYGPGRRLALVIVLDEIFGSFLA